MTQQQLNSKAFAKGSFYIMRHDNSYMIMDCVPADPKAPSGHKHNSRLSFELFAYDKSFIIDPGTYIYTTDMEMRNLFRSTRYHNTVVVDDKEQNRFDDDQLFTMNLDAAVNVNRWIVTENYDFLDAEHNGYSRLNVVHRRQIYFNKEEKYWVITDMLTGEGCHKYDLYFHFAPMELKEIDELVIETDNKTGANIVIAPLETDGIKLEIENGWVSYSYGKKVEAPIVKYSKTAEVPTEFITCITSGQVPSVEEIGRNMKRCLNGCYENEKQII
ncbi:MAG: heparinase II/III-family protein [Methanophagales archaeon]|nr:heparinase II/III-family protein [Methanophagales archaeon]